MLETSPVSFDDSLPKERVVLQAAAGSIMRLIARTLPLGMLGHVFLLAVEFSHQPMETVCI